LPLRLLKSGERASHPGNDSRIVSQLTAGDCHSGGSDAFARVSEHVEALIGARAGVEVIALRG